MSGPISYILIVRLKDLTDYLFPVATDWGLVTIIMDFVRIDNIMCSDVGAQHMNVK